MTINVAVVGAGGRMGRQIIDGILANKGMVLCAALEKLEHPKNGEKITRDVSFQDVFLGLNAGFKAADVVIDFTNPETSLEIIELASEMRRPVVTGTTGFTEFQLEEIKESSNTIAIVQSYNFSIGVNLLLRTIRDYASILNEDFDIDIVESHHRLKKDAPSGTAIKMAGAAAEGRGRRLDDLVVYNGPRNLHTKYVKLRGKY